MKMHDKLDVMRKCTGCSLSPLLFALYVAGMGRDLSKATQGVLLHTIRVSALFFAVRCFSLNDDEL